MAHLPTSAGTTGHAHPRMAWIHVSTKVDTYQQHRETVEGGVGPVAGA